MGAPWVQKLCLICGVSPEPSPVPGMLQSLETGLLNARVTEGEWIPTRQLSLNVLHGSTKPIHCLNQKCYKILVHLSCLHYLKTIPFSYLCFTEVYSIPTTVVTTLASSLRAQPAGRNHTPVHSRQNFQLKTSICREMLQCQAADEPL